MSRTLRERARQYQKPKTASAEIRLIYTLIIARFNNASGAGGPFFQSVLYAGVACWEVAYAPGPGRHLPAMTLNMADRIIGRSTRSRFALFRNTISRAFRTPSFRGDPCETNCDRPEDYFLKVRWKLFFGLHPFNFSILLFFRVSSAVRIHTSQ